MLKASFKECLLSVVKAAILSSTIMGLIFVILVLGNSLLTDTNVTSEDFFRLIVLGIPMILIFAIIGPLIASPIMLVAASTLKKRIRNNKVSLLRLIGDGLLISLIYSIILFVISGSSVFSLFIMFIMPTVLLATYFTWRSVKNTLIE